MSESKKEKPKKNVAERYKEYVCNWFGVVIDPESPEVTIPQWKFYRLARMNKQLRESNYMFFFLVVVLFIFMLWYSIVG